MAAASLPERPPNIHEIVMVAPQMSTQALIHELQELFNKSNIATGIDARGSSTATAPMSFPAGLLTSLFCMSSSLSWIDARQLGIQYLRNARSVIELLDMKVARLSAEDRELLEFFRGCLLYEEMLRSLVTDDQEDIQALLDWKLPPVTLGTDDSADGSRGSGSGGSSRKGLDLHPWAGIPVVLIGLFGKVMALCRRSRKAWRQTAARATYQGLYQAMLDIQEGKQLEERLLSFDVQRLVEGRNGGTGMAAGKGDTRDSRALEAHLYTAAEAFRLSALLQLYQTFPDLMSQKSQHQQLAATNETDSLVLDPGAPSQALMLLVLHIINLLAEIPPNSPMRCLQPLLCLCAGSALRQDTSLVSGGGSSPEANILGHPSDIILFRGAHRIWTGQGTEAEVMASLPAPPTIEPTVVHLARSTIRERLVLLEQNLPPRPIVVARQLLETVWATYDTEVPPSRSHWLDIMAETNFESVFG